MMYSCDTCIPPGPYTIPHVNMRVYLHACAQRKKKPHSTCIYTYNHSFAQNARPHKSSPIVHVDHDFVKRCAALHVIFYTTIDLVYFHTSSLAVEVICWGKICTVRNCSHTNHISLSTIM